MTPLRLQHLLVLAGFSIATDGDPGPETTAAVVAFQGAHGLTPDGEVGPKTIAALEAPLSRASAIPTGPCPPTLRAAILALVPQHIREQPREVGSNAGPWCELYGVRAAWCGAWVQYVAEQAATWSGGALVLPNVFSASCDVIGANAARERRLVHGSELAPGDVFLVGDRADFRHTGYVIGRAGAKWVTAEGNTNLDGSREGWGLLVRHRSPTAYGVSLG